MTVRHDCHWAQAVLSGEAPMPQGSEAAFHQEVQECPECSAFAASLEAIDHLAASLPVLAVPTDLSLRTLDRVRAEMQEDTAPTFTQRPNRPSRRRSVLFWGGALTMAAAAALFVMPRDPVPAPPERLVARGSAASLPTVSLKMAVHDGAELQRHRADQKYPSGTRVQFRVGLDQAAEVALLRVADDRVDVVTRTSMNQGDQDILLGSNPLAWEVEPGEGSAHFVVLAGPKGAMPDDLTEVVGSDAGNVGSQPGPCATVTALACDQRLLQVSP
ncbi:MAG: hypothetical protein CL927_01020 [Deltaproteobacteria bacterium]|nr:hypothetical protein [Deltaproteobacteria bacterium]HCH62718.1 hypothetical protein [Deltaproteobacteria bacterium]